MQPNSLTLRVSPAGRMFMRFLVAINTGDPNRIADFIESNYSASVLRDFDLNELVDYYMRVYEQTGGMDIHKVYYSQDYVVMVITIARKNEALYLDKLKVDDLPPYAMMEYLHSRPPAQHG